MAVKRSRMRGNSRALDQDNAEFLRGHGDDYVFPRAGVHIEDGLGGGVHPQPVSGGAQVERDGLVGGRALGCSVVLRAVPDDLVGVIELVETLAQTVIAIGRVLQLKTPVPYPVRGAGEFIHAFAHMLDVKLVCRERLALEGNVVQAHAGGGCSLAPGCVSRNGKVQCIGVEREAGGRLLWILASGMTGQSGRQEQDAYETATPVTHHLERSKFCLGSIPVPRSHYS